MGKREKSTGGRSVCVGGRGVDREREREFLEVIGT